MALGIAHTTSAFAQEKCSDVLVYNYNATFKNDYVRLAYLHSISSENFSKLKSQGVNNAGAQVSGVSLSDYSSYSDFQEVLRRESELYHYDYDARTEEVILSQTVPSQALDAYVKCISADQPGVYMWLSDSAPFDPIVSLNIRWKGAVGQTKAPLVGHLRIAGGSISDDDKATIPQTWKSGETVTVFLTKTPPGGLAKAAIKIGGYSGELTIPAKPPTVNIGFPVVSTTIDNQTDRDDIDKDVCINPPSNGLLLPSTAMVTVVNRIGDPGRAYATLKSATPFSACMHTHVQTDKTGRVYSVRATLSANARTVSVVP